MDVHQLASCGLCKDSAVLFQVVEELSQITGISVKSIQDFTHVTLMHITRTNFTVE